MHIGRNIEKWYIQNTNKTKYLIQLIESSAAWKVLSLCFDFCLFKSWVRGVDTTQAGGNGGDQAM